MTEAMQTLYDELAALKDRVPGLQLKVNGRKYVHGSERPEDTDINHLAPRWVHFAHRGTLEKIDDLLPHEGPHETFELLASARTLLENLVWLRLMEADSDFGLVFYGQLLRNQRQNCEIYLSRLADEAALFETAAEIDAEIGREMADAILHAGDPSVQKHIWDVRIHGRTRLLEDMIRREFALYAEQAGQIGYSLQARILRTRTAPRCQAQLDNILGFQSAFDKALPRLLSPRLMELATSEWNWRERAAEAGLEKHYRFIDGLVNRLLHATPINLIADKRLVDEEKRQVLDYIVVTARDLLEIVEQFSHPGMTNLSFVKMQ
ncbi:hypothetical protein [Cupriavidus sp. AU9028]|uniref:hypothetical protein n=1 Tax=Cupriavidus sp. AU9028 TaxID=2871157 RepID=UPI001C951EAA|nr:hypothetical protein [Cupriavidus sp. AU9028]MBY4898533.1 hypothetical protein [Cupriavidus sp. AU9028]